VPVALAYGWLRSDEYNKKKFGLRLELWKPIPAVLYEGRFTNGRHIAMVAAESEDLEEL
jgi:hypothetical protein